MTQTDQEKAARSNGGNAAFARPASDNNMSEYGITKREYFAAMALQGLIASSAPESFPDTATLSEKAVEAADALLLELSK